MSAPGPAQRAGPHSQLIAAGLSLAALVLCALMCVDGMRLARLGLPWAAAQAEPVLEPSAEPASAAIEAPTLTPAPGPAALLPTATSELLPARVLPVGQACGADQVRIEAVDRLADAAIRIGRDTLSAAVYFCLQSVPSAQLLLALVSVAAEPRRVPLGSPALIQRGDGRYAQQLAWDTGPLPVDLAGEYRLVAAITIASDGPVLASDFGGQYRLEAP